MTVRREASKPSVQTTTMDAYTPGPLTPTTMGRTLENWRWWPTLPQDAQTLTMITHLCQGLSCIKIVVGLKWPVRPPVLERKRTPLTPQPQIAVGLSMATVASKGTELNWKTQIQRIPPQRRN
jgi:hypothetical protein